jgi:uncharacterized protein with PIN domain
VTAESVPRGLSKRAGRLWRAVLAEYDLSEAEFEVLRCACEALDRADEAGAIVSREGVVVLDRYGSPKVHPAADLEARSRALFARLVAQLGVKVAEVESAGTRQARKAATARWSTHQRRADGAA